MFVCYDKTYQERARELHARLANDLQGKLSRDVVVFIDQETLEFGDAWDARIRAALASARVLIILLNDGLVVRPYCRFEIETFLSRMAAGEKCHILPVRWQRDSEIYRVGTLGTGSADALDQAYLGSLPAEAVELVRALREIQFLDGVALREDGIGSEPFNVAFRQLSTEVTRLYRLALREQAGSTSASSSAQSAVNGGGVVAGASPPFWRFSFLSVGIAVIMALAIVAAGLFAFGPFGSEPAVVKPDPPGGETEATPQWTAAGDTVENRSGGDVIARRLPRLDASELETLAPGAIRPALGVDGPVLAAEVDGVRWLSYPTPVTDVRGFVQQADLATPDPEAGN